MPLASWFSPVIEDAGVLITDENSDRIEEVIRDYVDASASSGRCSRDLREAGAQIAADGALRRELAARVRSAAPPAIAVKIGGEASGN